MARARQHLILYADQLCNSQVHYARRPICRRASKSRRAATSLPRCAEGSCDNLPLPENINPVNLCERQLEVHIAQQWRGSLSLDSHRLGIMLLPAFPDLTHAEHTIDLCFYPPPAIT